MSSEEESSLEREADGPQGAAAGEAAARDAERGREDRDADPDDRALPRREPAARRGNSVVSSPHLSVEQLAELRERLAGLKAESQTAQEE